MIITIAELKELLRKVTDKLNDYVFQELESDFEIKPSDAIEAEIIELETTRKALMSAFNLAELHTTVDIDIYDNVSKLPLGEAYKLKQCLVNQGNGLGDIFINHTKKDSDTAKEIAKLLTQIEERYLIVNNAIGDTELSTNIEIEIDIDIDKG